MKRNRSGFLLATALLWCELARSQANVTVQSQGDNSPAVNAHTVTVTYQTVQISQTIEADENQLSAILPSLRTLLDARLRRLEIEQTEQGRTLNQIKDEIKGEILEQLHSLKLSLDAKPDTEKLITEFKRQLLQTSVRMSLDMNIEPRARCPEANCVELSRAGKVAMVHVSIRAREYAQIGSSGLGLGSIVIRCADPEFPYDAVTLSRREQSLETWIYSRPFRYEVSPGPTFHASLDFVPQARCEQLTVTSQVVDSRGEVHEATKRLRVRATDLLVGPDETGTNIATDSMTWTLEERRILFGVTSVRAVGAIGVFGLTGTALTDAGRRLRSELINWYPSSRGDFKYSWPKDFHYMEYYRKVDVIAWDKLFYNIFRQWNSCGAADKCLVLTCSRIARIFDSTGIETDRWVDECHRAARTELGHLIENRRTVRTLKLESIDRGPSIFYSDSGSDSVLHIETPIPRRRQLLYLDVPELDADRVRLDVEVYGEPRLWLMLDLNEHYTAEKQFEALGFGVHLGIPWLWDTMQTDGGMRFDAPTDDDHGRRPADIWFFTSTRLNLSGLATLMSKTSTQVLLQMGVGAQTDLLRGFAFLDSAIGYTFRITEDGSPLLDARIAVNWMASLAAKREGYLGLNMGYPFY